MTYNLLMWDFKLKKTRIIFLGSVIYSWLLYWGITTNIGSKSWGWYDLEEGFYVLISPVIIYWIGIPLYRWIMKGK